KSNTLRAWPGINHLRGKALSTISDVVAQRFANLMTMNAALHHVPFPIELRLIFRSQFRNINRRLKSQRPPLFASERSFIARITFVNLQCRFQREFVAGRRLVLRIFLMTPRPITPVHGSIAVEKERGKRKVVIKLKSVQLKRIRVNDSYADELIQH